MHFSWYVGFTLETFDPFGHDLFMRKIAIFFNMPKRRFRCSPVTKSEENVFATFHDIENACGLFAESLNIISIVRNTSDDVLLSEAHSMGHFINPPAPRSPEKNTRETCRLS
jgi:hypothetical protein